MNVNLEQVQLFLTTTVAAVALKVVAALAFWIIGRWLIGKAVGLMQAAMNRNHMDSTLTKYVGSILAVALNIALALGILGYFGVETTSFAALLAGAGIRGGAVYGRSDKDAGYPHDKPVKPEHLAATIFHALGISPDTRLIDQFGRPVPVMEGGQPITELFG